MTISTDRDRVRLLIGDKDESNPLLQDDEIAVLLEQRQHVYSGGTVANIPAAAADACEAIAAQFSRQFNFAEDGQRFDAAQKASNYLAMATELRRRAGGASVPYATEDDTA